MVGITIYASKLVTKEHDVTCDIIDESFRKPIIVAPTNPSYSTSTSTSSSSDGFTCDASLMVENEPQEGGKRAQSHIS